MKHRPDTRGVLYFLIAVLSVWGGELANLAAQQLGPIDDWDYDTQ